MYKDFCFKFMFQFRLKRIFEVLKVWLFHVSKYKDLNWDPGINQTSAVPFFGNRNETQKPVLIDFFQINLGFRKKFDETQKYWTNSNWEKNALEIGHVRFPAPLNDFVSKMETTENPFD